MNLGCRKDRCHHEGSSFLGMGLTQRKAEQEMEGPESTSFEPLDSDKLKAYCASRSISGFRVPLSSGPYIQRPCPREWPSGTGASRLIFPVSRDGFSFLVSLVAIATSALSN